jgi:hypothetical protein
VEFSRAKRRQTMRPHLAIAASNWEKDETAVALHLIEVRNAGLRRVQHRAGASHEFHIVDAFDDDQHGNCCC